MTAIASADTSRRLPLFPLNAVLFPFGVLPLRIFETRYIDMVRDCMQHDQPFGVVLREPGGKAGMPAVAERVGCLARIVDFDLQEDSVLMLRTEGGRRFRILQEHALANGRIDADVTLLEDDRVVPVSDLHLACAAALKTVIDDINRQGRSDSGERFRSPFADPAQLDSAGWVANRWSEILPIPLKARQKLLELGDATSRLEVVHRYLQQHRIV